MNGTHVDGLDRTSTKVRRHGMTLGDSVLLSAEHAYDAHT